MPSAISKATRWCDVELGAREDIPQANRRIFAAADEGLAVLGHCDRPYLVAVADQCVHLDAGG
jgi:hypothetical protein